MAETDEWRRPETMCFGCATDNPSGLHLEIEHRGDGTCVALFRPRPDHEGPPGHLHGGLAAAALDELMGWAAHETEDDGWVTATLEVRYRRPVPLDGGPYRLEAQTGKATGRRKRMTARLLLAGDAGDTGDTTAVEAQGVFVRVH